MNLKVHFAGGENINMASILKEAGVNYLLGTVYSLIVNHYKKGSKNFDPLIIKYWKDNFKGSILDSGIFTLIYGADKNKKMDRDTFIRWQNTLIDFIHMSGYNGYPVEVDAQKILGVDEAWRLRTAMKDALPNHTLIHVWHAQDGQKGLDRLIEYSDYMAFSVQELRKIKGIDHKDYAIRMASYIKSKKPNIKIHLLACTELELLKTLNFCTSADSTGWLQVNKFGQMKVIQEGKVKVVSKDEIKKSLPAYHDRVKTMMKGLNQNTEDRDLTWQSAYIMAVEELIKIYSYYAGPQN